MSASNEVGGVSPAHLGLAENAVGPARGGAPGGAASDGVTLSPSTQGVSELLANLNNLPDTRPDVVAHLQERARSGERPSGQQVAHRILRGPHAQRVVSTP